MNIAYYFTTWNSSGLDEYDSKQPETLPEAIKIAQKRIRSEVSNSHYNAHAVITEGGYPLATIGYDKGRIYTKKPKKSVFRNAKQTPYQRYVTKKSKEFGWTEKQVERYFKTGKKPLKRSKGGQFVRLSSNVPITKAQIIATQKVRQAKKDKYKRVSNPSGLVKIYAKVTRIEAQKGSTGNFPGEKFYHNFKRPYPSLYGTPDRKTLVIK